jgi:hypothetical protein
VVAVVVATTVIYLKHLELVELVAVEMAEVHQEHQPHNQELLIQAVAVAAVEVRQH